MALNIIKKIIPTKIKDKLKFLISQPEFNPVFYGQAGEDGILRNFFVNKFINDKYGFYVDVGAYHPIYNSNTYFFYTHGWTGINIDATPGSMEMFKKYRSRDINLELAILNTNEEMSFFVNKEQGVMNSFFSSDKGSNIEEIKVKPCTLKEVLDKYLPLNTEIDFFNIDTEGADIEVLKSNDWTKYRPKVVAVELEGCTFEDIQSNEITKFLNLLGYYIYAKTFITFNVGTVFFVDKNFRL